MSRVVVQDAPRVGRVGRRPQHKFQLRFKPWQIQPFMIAPVLPGETMKNALLQSRIATDPIRHPLVGWWSEHYFFYVKHRDLHERDLLTEMVLNKDADLSSLHQPANLKYYHFGGTIPWLKLCTDRIVEEFFRDEEDTGTYMIDGLHAAQINEKSFLDSAVFSDQLDFQDVDVDANNDGTITAKEISDAMNTWNFMRQNGMTEMDYEDFLATYGVRVPRAETHRPELLRYVREWSYPTNTINPSDGSPSTAVVWSHTERLDKDRFFREPGFIVGLTVCRPKVYLSKQVGAAVGLMNDAFSWLPAITNNDPRTSLRLVPQGTGPIPSLAEEYWIDVRDLLLHGDQFVNHVIGEASSAVNLPAPDLQKTFPTLADADALFSGDRKEIRVDGIVTLNILGTQRDQSPTTNRQSVLTG